MRWKLSVFATRTGCFMQGVDSVSVCLGSTKCCASLRDTAGQRRWPQHALESASTLCLVMAPTIRGHTIPESVPTPLEMPMRMLAYRGAMSRWFTLKPKQGRRDTCCSQHSIQNDLPLKQYACVSTDSFRGS